jgi:hypothetical protein
MIPYIKQIKPALIFIFFLTMAFSGLMAQRTYQSKSTFDYTFQVGPQQFVINYDVQGLMKNEEYLLDLSVIDKKIGKLTPRTFEVDFKDKRFQAGERKSIIWYWKQDYPDIKNVKVDLQLQPVKTLGGPEQTWKSFVFPGWGHQAVSSKKMPYFLAGALAYSLIGSGVYFTGPLSDNTYDKYLDARDVNDMDRYLDRAKNQFNAGQIMISAGAVIWLSDVVATYVKGLRNKKANAFIKAEKPLFKSLEDLKYYDVEAMTKKIAEQEGKLQWGFSDVDMAIPVTTEKKEHTYALIIGNEDYKSHQKDLTNEVNVDYAEADATMFKEYLQRTLGVPEKNIQLIINATSGAINQGIARLNALSMVEAGNAEVIFYYAGHGLPDENTKEPHIIPVDVSGTNLQYAIQLNEIYKKLTEHPAKRVIVFMDACFSGGARNQGLITMRGVKVKPKKAPMQGNLLVISSSSGEESSGAYKEKQHGMFTYYLLKKLKESKGDITYKQLADYVIENVKRLSVLVNNKLQTPQILGSDPVKYTWQEWKVK